MIKKYDCFEVYQDGFKTFKGMALENEKDGFVRVVKLDEINLSTMFEPILVNVVQETYGVEFNIIYNENIWGVK